MVTAMSAGVTRTSLRSILLSKGVPPRTRKTTKTKHYVPAVARWIFLVFITEVDELSYLSTQLEAEKRAAQVWAREHSDSGAITTPASPGRTIGRPG